MPKKAGLFAAKRLSFFVAVSEIILDNRPLLIGRHILVVLRKELATRGMTFRPDTNVEQFDITLTGYGIISVATLDTGWC